MTKRLLASIAKLLNQRRKLLVAFSLILLLPVNSSSFPSGTMPLMVSVSSLEAQNESPSAPLPTEAEPVTGSAIITAPQADDRESHTTPQAINTSPQAIEISSPDALRITLSFAGDCTIGDDEKYMWNTFDEVYEKVKDPSYFFQGVKAAFADDDFTFINFEGTFTRATKKAVKQYRFKGDPSYINVLLSGSIEGVTLANNHSLDYLEKGFEDTVQALNEANIAYTYFETYFIKSIKGLKIGFLGYKGWEHEKRSNDLLEKHIKEMREQGVNFIIANFHWGDQNSYTPNALQKRMAYFAIDHGVDLVIGHHPHVLQGLEVYKGKNIVYSLGNFCFGGAPNPKDKDTIIYQHIITLDEQGKTILGTEYKIIPARVSSETGRNNYQPIIVCGAEENRILEKYQRISQGLSK